MHSSINMDRLFGVSSAKLNHIYFITLPPSNYLLTTQTSPQHKSPLNQIKFSLPFIFLQLMKIIIYTFT